jgi:hypothetical protein
MFPLIFKPLLLLLLLSCKLLLTFLGKLLVGIDCVCYESEDSPLLYFSLEVPLLKLLFGTWLFFMGFCGGFFKRTFD